MQRIDENTYIDDTLVTCAEYQLFIDEMREQGKYYQPDHWNSYKFPSGKAREPILGVRNSDAMAFCEWLTKRENIVWNYRLPLQTEATDYPINLFSQEPVGYWLVADNQHQWFWVRNTTSNARALEPDNVLAYAKNIDLYTPLDRIFAGNRTRISTIVRTLTRGFENPDHDFTDAIYRVLNCAVELNFDRARPLASNFNNVPNFVFILALENALLHRINFYSKEDDFKDKFYCIFIDLYTLQERIAGRSPAFEGIRLVKERIR